MNRLFFIALTLLVSTYNFAQNTMEKLPFYEIEDYPETYNSNFLVARMVDGLGFRYYWATEGLRNEDLIYKISETSRSSQETIEHLYGLSKFIRNSILENNKDETKEDLDFTELRKQTLHNLKVVSDALKTPKETFKFEETPVPFWNMLNGPIADALWHCGQVVMLRRASGNPFNSKVSVFSGKVKS